MKRFPGTCLLLAALSVPMAGAQAREQVRMTRFEGRKITGLAVGSSFEVELIRTPDVSRNRAVVEIDSRLESHLKLELTPDGIVRAGLEPLGWNDPMARILPDAKRKLILYLGELNFVELSGSVSLSAAESNAPFTGNDVRIRMSGSARIRNLNIQGKSVEITGSGSGRAALNARAERVAASVSGSGHISLQGGAPKTDLSVSGSGAIRGEEFKAKNATVKVAGSGSIHIFAEESIDGSVAGSGNVRYKGDPPRIQVSKWGSGSIRPL